MTKTPAQTIEKALLCLPALTIEDFTEIVDDLIGRTQRSVTDEQIEKAFKAAMADYQH